MLVLNPSVHKLKRIQNILFPTDFSKESWARFEDVVAFAREQKAKIIVFHKVVHNADAAAQSLFNLLGGVWLPTAKFFSEEGEKLRKHADASIEWAKKHGVEAKYVTDEGASSTGETIIRAAKKYKCDLIAVTTKANAVEAAVLGSTARQVVRYATVPVWIVVKPR